MKLTEYLRNPNDITCKLAKQMGINYATIRLPEDGRDLSSLDVLDRITKEYQDIGMTPKVIEPIPNFYYESVKQNLKDRDEKIEKIIKLIKNMGSLGIEVLCANFMAKIGWFRTEVDIVERGGAYVSGFSYKDTDRHLNEHPEYTQDEIRENLYYFLDAVKPHLVENNVKLALHPDDPPVPYLNGIGRILISADEIENIIKYAHCPNIGITMCQGTYAAMGEDISKTIKRFDDKIFFVHFRDILGDRYNFHETFHDNGLTDMVEAIRAYKDIGFDGYMRVDHVPSMTGEQNKNPGYENMGRLYAVGYLKGIIEAVYHEG